MGYAKGKNDVCRIYRTKYVPYGVFDKVDAV